MQLSELKNQGIINKGITGGKISFLAGCVAGDELYFSAWTSNGFYKMDLKTGVCIFLGIFENETKSRALHNQAIFFDNAIWFIPTHGGDKIVKINIETLEKNYICLPEKGRAIRSKDGNFGWEFKCCYKNGDSVFWLAPLGYNMLLKVDMLTDQIIEYGDFKNRVTFKDGQINFSDACMIEDDIWLYPRDNAEIVIFNTVTEKFRFISGQKIKNDFGFIRSYKNWVIFLSRNKNKSILLIDSKTFKEKEILLDVNWKESRQPMYMVADIVGRFLILAPYLAREFIAIDLETGDVQVDRNLHQQMELLGWKEERYQSSFCYGSKIIYASDTIGAPLMIYDMQENSVFYMEMRVDLEKYKKTLVNMYDKNKEDIKKWMKQKGKFVSEDEFLVSPYYFLSVDVRNEEQSDDVNSQKTIGESIFLSAK